MLSKAPESRDQYEFRGDNKMPTREIEEFAKILVREVRDAAIQDCDILRHPEAQSIGAKRWRKLGVGACDAVVEAIIPDCVDVALYYLLHAIDDGMLRLQFVASDGKVMDLTSEGLSELAGWYAMRDGWRSAYSEQRFVEDVDTEDGEGKPPPSP